MTTDEILNWPLNNKIELISIFSVNDPLIIFDVGSCDGIDSIKYSKLFPNSNIFCFEPLQENINELVYNINKYELKNVNVISEALNNSIGKSIFYISSGRPDGTEVNDTWNYGKGSSSLFSPSESQIQIFPWLKFETQTEVNCNTLDNFCIQKSLKHIDFIHMDVQGAELEVLKGGQSIIKKIKTIWLEVEQKELYNNQPLKNDVEKFMQENGFVKIKDTVGEIYGDQFYINKNLFNLQRVKRKLIFYKYLFKLKSLLRKIRKFNMKA